MKIVFITSCLEPGRDGVGDYTRRLAGELIRHGHECRLVALNERQWLETKDRKPKKREQSTDDSSQRSLIRSQVLDDLLEQQDIEGIRIECLRLSDSLSWSERAEVARKWLDGFDPDWVSLQFVPFGFHPKGLPLGLSGHLKTIVGSRPLHWMFHELWVLWNLPLSLRKRFLGQCQKLWFRSCLSTLKPRSVATQLPLYQAELKKIGVAAKVIPLHGSIPVCLEHEADKWLADRCAIVNNPKGIKAGFFGNILSTFDLSLISSWIAELNIEGNQLFLMSAGKISEETANLWNSLERELKSSATFITLGELSEREASLYFSALDYGLTSYPPELMGKSGSVAAMREHGLQVIVCGSLGKWSTESTKNSLQNSEADQPYTVNQSAMSLLQQLQKAN